MSGIIEPLHSQWYIGCGQEFYLRSIQGKSIPNLFQQNFDSRHSPQISVRKHPQLCSQKIRSVEPPEQT
ncbi:hypothetical protein MARINON1_60006 [Marinobacter salarius]|nr:hypothetical protein MBHK15_100483 [Marinobacter salarius]VXC35842.1 hypothetical protein MARINON1_60006 [Marinobacter salarius]